MYMKDYLCKQCFKKFVRKRIQKTIRHFEMINSKDKLVLVFSAGPKSIIMLDYLTEFAKRINLEIIPVVVDQKIPEYSKKLIESSKKLTSNLIILRTKKPKDYEETLKLREQALIKFAKKKKAKVVDTTTANKFSLLILKSFFEETPKNLKEIRPKIIKNRITIIRPFFYMANEDLEIYAKIKNLKFFKIKNPQRKKKHLHFKKFLEEMKKSRPGIMFSIMSISESLANTKS